jgi:hypothetical protein
LVAQNREKFHRINPDRSSSVYGLGIKDPSGDTIFGMAQTLGRNGGIEILPPLDVLVIDEAGYENYTAEQANMLFQLVNSRYEHGSI